MTLRTLFAVAALCLGTSTTAQAFDMPPPVDAPEINTISSASGWYIRGDIGYNAAFSSNKPSTRSYRAAQDDYETESFDNARFSGDYSLNAGVGYQFNDWLRSDATLDYFTAKFNGKRITDGHCSILQPNGTDCGSAGRQNLAALGLLANGYVDLGTYWGLTPYLGAGAGMTNLDWGNYSASKYCVNGNARCLNAVDYKNKTYEGAEGWRFTYALMTGVSYDVAAGMKLDLGYRFSQIAGGDMFDWSTAEKRRGANGVKGEDKGFGRHEFRAGLRITSW
jgi:opacity protein-like surface antigen